MHAGWCPSGTSNPAGLPMVDRSVRFRHTSASLIAEGYGRSWMSPRKQKPFRAAKEVKRRARREIGSPPPTQRHESRKHKPPKHKKQELQAGEEGT